MRDVLEIETQRLRLRGLRIADARRIGEFCNDPGVGRNLAMTPLPYLDVAAEGWIMILRARAALLRDVVFGVELPGEGLIGCIGAHSRAESYEVGYWYGRPYWGLGYATEALTAFVDEARTLGELVASHFVDNPASGRVLSKAGFVYTGEVLPQFSMARGHKSPCKRMRLADGGARRDAGSRAEALS